MLTLVSLMQIDSIFYNKSNSNNRLKQIRPFVIDSSDHLTKINIFNQFYFSSNKKSFCKENGLDYRMLMRVQTIRKQMMDYLKQIVKKRNKKMQKQSNEQLQISDMNVRMEVEKDVWVQQSLECLAKGCSYNIGQLNQDGTYTLKVCVCYVIFRTIRKRVCILIVFVFIANLSLRVQFIMRQLSPKDYILERYHRLLFPSDDCIVLLDQLFYISCS